MTHYRVYKLARTDGGIIKGKDIDASDDADAIAQADADEDCPVCEIWQADRKIGSIEEE